MEMTYATLSAILMVFCFLHFVLPPVKHNAKTILKICRGIIGFSPLLLTVLNAKVIVEVAAQVVFGILFGAILTFAIIRVSEEAAEKALADKTKKFQDRAAAYNDAHQICDELLRQRAIHLQRYETEQEADLELVTRLDLETRSAFDRLKEAVHQLESCTSDFPNAAQAAARATGQLTMFKNAIAHLREAEMEYGWHREAASDVSEIEIDDFRHFLNEINPNDFASGSNKTEEAENN